jgi:hypothetical protein
MQHQVIWECLTPQERLQERQSVQNHTSLLCRHYWPYYLMPTSLSSPLNQEESRLFKKQRQEILHHFIRWIEESLYEHQLTKEALKGILVSGTLGLALLQDLRKHFPTLHFKAVTPQTAFKGAQIYLDSLYSNQHIQIKRGIEESIYICSPDWPSRLLIRPNQITPCYQTMDIDAAPNGCSLWSKTRQGELTCLGFTHHLHTPSRLSLTYQSRGEMDIQWLSSLSSSDSHPNWTWTQPSLWSV